jgi:O-antigen/teichoic acid export membrane protein
MTRINVQHKADLIGNAGWMLGGYSVRLLIQAIYFILMARSLGPVQYGIFAVAAALISVAAPFVGLGSGNLMIREVARDRKTFNVSWGNALVTTVGMGTVLSLAAIAGSKLLVGTATPSIVIASVAVSDLIFARFVDLSAQAFQAIEKMKCTAHINAMSSLLRLIGLIGVTAFVPHCDARHWCVVYAITSCIAGLLALGYVTVRIGMPAFNISLLHRDVGEGALFAASASAQTIYNDIDKVLLGRLASAGTAGIYSAAYRIIDVAFSPVRALLAAAYPQLFRAGKTGLDGTVKYAVPLLKRAVTYSCVVSVALLIGANLVPSVLGPAYADTARAIQWLALIPIFRAVHSFLADMLTSAGYQGTRMVAQTGAAVVNVVADVLLIPAFSWVGAAWASLITDASLVVILTFITYFIHSRWVPPVSAQEVCA